MFVLGALHLQQFHLCGTVLHQSLLLREIQAGGISQVVPRRDESERVLLEGQTVFHHVDLGIEFAQGEVIADQLGGEHQPRVLEIRGRLLGRCLVAFNLAPHPPE